MPRFQVVEPQSGNFKIVDAGKNRRRTGHLVEVVSIPGGHTAEAHLTAMAVAGCLNASGDLFDKVTTPEGGD